MPVPRLSPGAASLARVFPVAFLAAVLAGAFPAVRLAASFARPPAAFPPRASMLAWSAAIRSTTFSGPAGTPSGGATGSAPCSRAATSESRAIW